MNVTDPAHPAVQGAILYTESNKNSRAAQTGDSWKKTLDFEQKVYPLVN